MRFSDQRANTLSNRVIGLVIVLATFVLFATFLTDVQGDPFDPVRQVGGRTYHRIGDLWYLWDGHEEWEVVPGELYIHCDKPVQNKNLNSGRRNSV